jgi:transcription antitermination factor NusB
MPLKNRRKAREAALRALYQMSIGNVALEDALEEMRAHSELPDDLQDFAVSAVRGVHENRKDLDGVVSRALKDWELSRLAVVDRTLLLLGAYELFHCPDIPPAVTINEAIELAKKYSTAESGSFVNGVLAGVAAQSPKAALLGKTTPPGEWEEPQEEGDASSEPPIEMISEDAPELQEITRSAKPPRKGDATD